MIYASKKLKEYLEISGMSNREFSEKINIEESFVSRVLNRKEEASKPFIESVMSVTGLPFEAAFDISDRRTSDK